MRYFVLFALLFAAVAVCQTLRQPVTSQIPTSTAAHQNTTSSVQKTAEELEDETEMHEKFLDSIDNDSNPYRNLRNKSGSSGTGDIKSVYAQCQSGLCCTKRNTFFPYGHICGQPKNECQIAICSGQSAECYTINTNNGTRCAGGQCYDGECIKDCVGECCDGKVAAVDGTACSNGGICVNGVCAKKCYGDCCEMNMSFAKPDGAPCAEGTCSNGKCVSSKSLESMENNVSSNGKNVVAVIHEETKPSALESAWEKLVGEEKGDKKKAAETEAARKKAELDAAAKKEISQIEADAADAQTELKAARDEEKSSKKTQTIVLIVCGCCAAFLALVLLIVLVAKAGRNKKVKKDDEEKAEEAYDAF